MKADKYIKPEIEIIEMESEVIAMQKSERSVLPSKTKVL